MKSTLRVSLFILTLSLFFRLWHLGQTSLQMDEVTWMVHSKELIYSAFHRDGAFFRENAWWNWTFENYAIGLPTNLLGGLSHLLLGGTSRFSLKLLPDIISARLPIAVISALLPLLVYRFLVLVGQSQVGFLAALGLAASPLLLASDRWFLNDSFLALFSFLSLSSFYLAGKSKKFSLWPGIWLALAFLTKPNGVLVGVGWLGCLLLSSRRTYFKLLLSNSIVFFLTTTILWPTAWFNPIFAIPEYLLRQLSLAQVPIQSLFFGRVTLDPGDLYYPFHLFTKNPEIVVIGVICSLLFLFQTNKRQRLATASPIILYCLVSYALIHFSGTKAGPRYLLPIIPWIYVLSSFGFYWFYLRLNRPLRTALIFVGLISFLSVLIYFPENQIYVNQFAGGPRGISGSTRLGVCLGGRNALLLLDQRRDPGAYYLYGCADNGPYYTDRVQTKNLKEANYFIEETWLSELHHDDSVMPYVNKNFKQLFPIYQSGALTARVYERTK